MTMARLHLAARRFWRQTSGQDLVEYALTAGFVAVAEGSVFPTTIAPAITQIFSRVASLLTAS
jgi:Flp pilus assembly pilin Flp